MEFAGLRSQEKEFAGLGNQGEEDRGPTRKGGSGKFPRDEAIEKVREFNAIQVFD